MDPVRSVDRAMSSVTEAVAQPASHTTSFEMEPEIPQHASEREDIPPNGGYGWVCVACVLMINAHTWGINSVSSRRTPSPFPSLSPKSHPHPVQSFGVFLAYYLTHNTYPGATPFQFAFIGGLSISQALMASPAITITTRLYGTRTTMFIGVALITASLVGASFADAFWQLLLAQGVAFGWGMGFLYVGSLAIIPQWFSTRRSLAMGIAASGAGIGGIVYTLAAQAAIASVGLAWTFRILAGCGFTVNTVCALLLRDRNKAVQPRQTTFDWRMFRRVEILLVVGWGVMSELGYIVLYYSLPSYAASVGLSAQQGSIVGALLTLGLAVGRPVVGYYSDAIGRINMAMLMTAFCGLLCLVIWVFAKTYAVLLLFALLSGTVCGTFWSTIAPVGAEVVGLKELPTALSMTWLLLVFPCTFAEPIAVKMLANGANPWLSSQLFVGFMFLGAALCTLLLRSWKIDQNEEKSLRDGEGVPCRQQSVVSKALRIMRLSVVLKKV